MTIFGTLMAFIFFFWCFISLMLMRGFGNTIIFLRSMNFIIVCVGYIIILAVFYMLKNTFRKIEGD